MGNMKKQLSICVLAVVEFLTGSAQSHATQTWCAEVRRDLPDGFLNLRSGPSTSDPVLARLRGGEYVEIDTANCAERFSPNWIATGTVCVEAGSSWAFVENVPRLGGREHGGWINTHYIEAVVCRDLE